MIHQPEFRRPLHFTKPQITHALDLNAQIRRRQNGDSQSGRHQPDDGHRLAHFLGDKGRDPLRFQLAENIVVQ
ncbi:hypothetical protein D3C73_1415450 [compost metagenome]